MTQQSFARGGAAYRLDQRVDRLVLRRVTVQLIHEHDRISR